MLGLILLALFAQDPPVQPVKVPVGSHPYVVSSASMEPGFIEGDIVLADQSRGDCGNTIPKAGDVVIQSRNGVPWIRRVIAGPGQTVQMINGRLYIDGLEAVRKPLAEGPSGGGTLYAEPLPNGARYQIQDLGDGFLDNTEVLSIGPDQWFLMGDNRDNAIDSRADGSVPTQAICATVYARQQDGAWVPL
mgnify:CR=1 FL=1|jgi:signal peptidase I